MPPRLRHNAPVSHDVIVVGAGPAGCAAAAGLARRGVNVLLLDRARFPRWKPCAGGISRWALPSIPEPLRDLFEHTADRAVLSLGRRRSTRLELAQPAGWTVHREDFDRAHLELVRALPGVEVREGCGVVGVAERADRVAVSTTGGDLTAAAVVGADGAGSVVSEAVRDPSGRRFALAFEVEAEVRGPAPELRFDLACVRGGYAWVFPKRGRCSLGGYSVATLTPGLRQGVERLVATFPALAALERRRAGGHRLPLGGTRQPLASGRIALAGDAADTVDPVTGEGIAHALRSGEMAAAAVHRFLAGGEPLAGHTAALWREVHADLRLARFLAGRLGRHPAVGFALLFGNRALCQLMVEKLRGELGYRRLVLAALLRSPAIACGWRPSADVSFRLR